MFCISNLKSSLLSLGFILVFLIGIRYLQFQKKKFVPKIETEKANSSINRQSSSERAAAEAKSLRETRAALKAAENKIIISAIKKNSSVSQSTFYCEFCST